MATRPALDTQRPQPVSVLPVRESFSNVATDGDVTAEPT